MAYRRITVQIKGDPTDNESLRLNDFIGQLDAIRNTLSHLERTIAEPDSSPIQYRIVGLRHSSPATIIFEAVPGTKGRDVCALVADRFMDGIKNIKRGIIPEDYDADLLESFKKIGPKVQKKNHRRFISLVSIATDSDKVDVEQSLESEIDTIVGPDEIMQGSICGTLELINIHAGVNTFRIYPIIGPPKVDCHFRSDQMNNAIAGINHYVNVKGALRYKRRDKFPYAVNDAEIEVYPDEQKLPSIFDLKGIAPDATGDLKSEDFVRKLRHETW